MIKVDVEIGLQSTWRSTEPFRPTKFEQGNFALTTDLDAYQTAIPTFISTKLMPYVVNQRGMSPYRELTMTIGVRIANVTHPKAAAGVVILPKAFRQFGFTDLEINAANPAGISQPIVDILSGLKTQAKY